jgi:hypothetical protein
LFIDYERRVLLGDLRDGDDDLFRLAAVLFGFGREEKRRRGDVLFQGMRGQWSVLGLEICMRPGVGEAPGGGGRLQGLGPT